MQQTYPNRRDHNIKQCKEWRDKLRIDVLKHYSNGSLKCSCCSESNVEFLALDHANGDGAEHRKCVGSGAAMYSWIRKHDYPEGFQVLCHNCNQSIGFYGYCPHQLVIQ